MNPRRRANAPFARWILLCGVVAAVELLAPAARAQVVTGTVDVHLGPPAGTTLVSSVLHIFSASAPFSSTVNEGAGTGSFTVTELPPASDYTTNVTSTSSTGLICSGSSVPFVIEANTTTILFVSLTCPTPARPAPALSASHLALLAVLLPLLAVLVLRRPTRTDVA